MMTTGVFHVPGATGGGRYRGNIRAANEMRAGIRRQRIVALTELIAEEVPIKKAAHLIGVSEQAATSMMAQIRHELGWQAR